MWLPSTSPPPPSKRNKKIYVYRYCATTSITLINMRCCEWNRLMSQGARNIIYYEDCHVLNMLKLPIIIAFPFPATNGFLIRIPILHLLMKTILTTSILPYETTHTFQYQRPAWRTMVGGQVGNFPLFAPTQRPPPQHPPPPPGPVAADTGLRVVN